MAQFLNTSAANYRLEELIKQARDRLILISPFLKFSGRMRELIEDKNRMKMDIRIIYGKTDLQADEMKWLAGLDFVRIGFCDNLHAKCYMSEAQAIITSLNLYEFSQVNNNEMGILVTREEDAEVFTDAYEEAQRIIRISEDKKIPAETAAPLPSVAETQAKIEGAPVASESQKKAKSNYDKLTTANLAKKAGLTTTEAFERLEQVGLLEKRDGRPWITDAGRRVGGEFRTGSHGPFFLWPKDVVEKVKDEG